MNKKEEKMTDQITPQGALLLNTPTLLKRVHKYKERIEKMKMDGVSRSDPECEIACQQLEIMECELVERAGTEIGVKKADYETLLREKEKIESTDPAIHTYEQIAILREIETRDREKKKKKITEADRRFEEGWHTNSRTPTTPPYEHPVLPDCPISGTPDQVAEFIKALVKTQGEMGTIKKDRTYTKDFQNSRTGEITTTAIQYATLDAILKKILEIGTKNGLAVMQHLPKHGTVKTIVFHESGAWMESVIEAQTSDKYNFQTMASGFTYLRRYALSAIFGIAAEADDDAMATMEGEVKGARKKKLDNTVLVKELTKGIKDKKATEMSEEERAEFLSKTDGWLKNNERLTEEEKNSLLQILHDTK